MLQYIEAANQIELRPKGGCVHVGLDQPTARAFLRIGQSFSEQIHTKHQALRAGAFQGTQRISSTTTNF
jgi:hypothetical protein